MASKSVLLFCLLLATFLLLAIASKADPSDEKDQNGVVDEKYGGYQAVGTPGVATTVAAATVGTPAAVIAAASDVAAVDTTAAAAACIPTTSQSRSSCRRSTTEHALIRSQST